MQSSQDFVRALKSTGTASSSKIDIAWDAWHNKSFYVPNKEDIIAEWILTTFTKDKSKSSAESAILDKQYWQLFGSLLRGDVQSTTEPQTLKWIKPLLLRFPLSPILLAFLSAFPSVPDIEKEPLFKAFTDVISSTWSIASQKMTTESMQECFGAWLASQPGNSVYEGNKHLGCLITTSYRNSLNNSSNKKKLYASFLQTYLLPWLTFISTYQSTTHPEDLAIIDAGLDTLFNLDILRQNLDSSTENALISHLTSLSQKAPQVILSTLAFVFRSYIAAIKKHRGALFSQGSQHLPGATLEEFREAGMRFLKACVALIDGMGDGDEEVGWIVKAALLETVDRENLFGSRQQDARVVLNALQEMAVGGLVSGSGGSGNDIVQCLTTIAKIDYDLVIPFLPRILPKLLWVSSTSPIPFAFLDELLKYHTKTRTMNTLIESLFASFKLQDLSLLNSASKHTLSAYQTHLSSPPLHLTFLSRLSKAIQTFMTESQAVPVVVFVMGYLREEWGRCGGVLEGSSKKDKEKEKAREEEGRPPKKKKRKSEVGVGMDVDQGSSPSSSAPASEQISPFCLGTRLAAVVLTSLPLKSLSAPVLEDVMGKVEELREGFLGEVVRGVVKGVKKSAASTSSATSSSSSWGLEVALASFLRLLYALDTASGEQRVREKLCKRLGEVGEGEGRGPEVRLEIFRYLLYNTSSAQSQEFNERIIDTVLQYLENHFLTTSSSLAVTWNGEAHQLARSDDGRGDAQGALAVLHMVVERWLGVFDQHATKDQLERFIKVILRVKPPSAASASYSSSTGAETQGMRAEHLLVRLLGAAEFWEMKNIRAVFLDLLASETSTDEVSDHITSLFYLMLYFPLEYFTWQLLHDLVKRAWALDRAFTGRFVSTSKSAATTKGAANAKSRKAEKNTSKAGEKAPSLRPLIVLRIFMKRAAVYSGHVPHETGEEIAGVLVHLMKEPGASGVGEEEGEYVRATIELVEVYVSKLLKSASKTGSAPLKTVLQQFSSTLFDTPHSVRTRSFSTVVRVLTGEVHDTKLPADFVEQLRTLEEQLSRSLLPRLESGAEDVELIEGWQGLLKLNTWLNAQEGKSQSIPPVGLQLASKLISSTKKKNKDKCAVEDQAFLSTLAVLLLELGYQPESERTRHLEIVIACYVAFLDVVDGDSLKALDEELGKTTRKLPIGDYTHLLDVVLESLSATRGSAETLTHVVHLATMLLREHPSHSLVHIQKFVFKCLSVFSGNDVFVTTSSRLRVEVLDLVSSYCINQQGALRPVDIASIWLLLSKFLAPSPTHDSTTDTPVFHKLTSIISALIRFRRDLVSQTLPHLGMILRQLILATRACRPNLGAKQTSLIMVTQPRWVAASHPLQADDAKALSRVLESLNTKTTVKSLSSSTSAGSAPQKAESLAKPFSKHAPFVLRAYVEVMNDPFCALSLEVRKALEAGLFVLCGMVNEHSRDALMVSGLDAGGKLILKALWKEYEKQRYVGKG